VLVDFDYFPPFAKTVDFLLEVKNARIEHLTIRYDDQLGCTKKSRRPFVDSAWVSCVEWRVYDLPRFDHV
jgi:hypothetical protein